MESIVIFAAGKGTRMKELTNSIPKPLIQIHGKPLLQYALELTKQHKFDRIIINTHHLAKQIEEFVSAFINSHPDFPEIIIEHEEVILETGGTIKNLSKLYDLGERIFTLNSDIIIRAKGNIFKKMLDSWEELSPDMLLLLQDVTKATGYIGYGDFNIEANSMVSREGEGPYPYIFSGLQILNPRKIAEYPRDIFSLQEYFPQIGDFGDRLKVRATLMEGKWYHASSQEDIKVIEEVLNQILDK